MFDTKRRYQWRDIVVGVETNGTRPRNAFFFGACWCGRGRDKQWRKAYVTLTKTGLEIVNSLFSLDDIGEVKAIQLTNGTWRVVARRNNIIASLGIDLADAPPRHAWPFCDRRAYLEQWYQERG